MKSLVLFALLISCVFATPAGPILKVFPRNNGGRVIGGQDASVDQFPYQVSLRWGFAGNYKHRCGGSIISPLYVLTAGHCVIGVPPFGRFIVNAGILKVSENGVLKNVESSVVHPLYQGDVGPYDIALLRLESPFTFTGSIQPIALPAACSEPQGQAVISGWGSTSNTSTPIMPEILQYIDVPILSYKECAAALTAIFGNPDPLDAATNICTGSLYDGVGACAGDSGGPLAQRGTNNNTVLIGIVSWGVSPCGSPGAPSVFVKVSHFIEFITENVSDLP